MEMSSPNHARLRRVIVAPVVLAATVFTGTAAAQDDDGARESNPYIRLTEPAGPPGTVTTAWGCGFSPERSIEMASEDPAGRRDANRLRTDATGCVAMTFSVPENARPGTMTIRLEQGDTAASTNFRVEESSGRTSRESGRTSEESGRSISGR
jgi:hypothetical protein